MSIVKTIAYMSTLIMAIVISWALTKSNIFVEGNTILALPWGIVTFVDLYIGFLYVGIWMVIREKLLHSILWIISLFFLGNLLQHFLTSCGNFYMLLTFNLLWRLFIFV